MAVTHGQIVFRHWKDGEGLSEVTKEFRTLEELFQLCTDPDEHLLVDRVYIKGTTEKGAARRLALVFQSVTILNAGEESFE
ncbi:MAG: hypothetical protein CUN55_00665 [Phototrophicales bacterium]|nr:MAG: hypothetical protein CUN55_00665 [Phototrophicales bacterium]